MMSNLKNPFIAFCYLTCLLSLAHSSTKTRAADVVLDFETFSLPAESAAPGDASQAPVVFQGVSFNRTWDTTFDCCPGAWAPSNQTDVTAPGFENSFSAYHLPLGGGFESSANYMVAFNTAGSNAEVQLPHATTVRGMYVTNTTYAYLAVVEGRDTAGSNTPAFVKGPFEDGDFFKLNVFGLDSAQQQQGPIEFFLADYRNGNREAISNWTWLDLTPLGDDVVSLTFELESSDIGMFGVNTPTYFAIDNLTLAAVPEPSTAWLAGVGPAYLLCMRRRNRSH